MTTERKILAARVKELTNELRRLPKGSLLNEHNVLGQVVAEELAAACAALRACDDIPGQRTMFAA